MAHACALCALRFSTTGEVEYHVRNDHAPDEPFVERQETVRRYRRPAMTDAERPRVLRLP